MPTVRARPAGQHFPVRAKSNRQVSRLLEAPRNHRGNGLILGRRARIDAIKCILVDDQMLLPNRVAAGPVLLYSQPVHRVAATRVERDDLDGRHLLLVDRVDHARIEAFLADRLRRIDAERWDVLAEKVGRIGYWEFEDYIPSPAGPGITGSEDA